MGYEEVETVLPADFVPQSDPAPSAAAVATTPATDGRNAHEVPVSESEPESDAEDATCGGKRRKKKKNRTGRSSSRRSIMSRWRARSKSRSKSKGREKGNAETASSDSPSTPSKGGDDEKKNEKKKKKKRSSRSFRTIKKSDSNSTEVVSNTTKAKTKDQKKEGSEDSAEERVNTMALLPTVREGSPSNTTTTTHSGDEEAAAAAAFDPYPEVSIAMSGLSIEVGDENENFALQVEAPSPSFEATKEEEVPDIMPAKEEEVPDIMPAVSKESVRSAKSNRSKRSVKWTTKSSKSGSGTDGAGDATIPTTADPAIDAAPSSDKSVRSTRSSKSTKSTKSAPALGPATAAALASDAASVKSSKSSSSSKKSLRSLPLKFRSNKSKDTETEVAMVIADMMADAAVDAENNVAEEEVEDPHVTTQDNSSKGKWVKKVSVSIGGYKTSFQFSDPMANLAEAVNDALNVVGNDDALAEQAKQLDEINAQDNDEEEEERDYDNNPTKLFMYLQQRAWGLALTQLQKNPDEARVWVYRKAKGPAPNVPDASTNPEAMVVQHNSLVVHDGTLPKFRWKLLPLHAAIVLGAPTEIIQDIIRANPNAARKTDERGSLPVHLAASRLDVDPEGEKVVLQLFGAYPDSIELQDRKGRNPPELAKLARARKEIEEQRKINSCSSAASQIGVERSESQHEKEVDGSCDGSSQGSRGNSEDADDDSVKSSKSSISGRFSQMLFKSKSTDTVDRRKKNKNKKDKDKKKGSSFLGLTPAKSMDTGASGDDEAVVDDATIFESLGPGFAFVKTSEAQEMRERSASEEEEEEPPTEEEIIVAAKKAMIAKEYQTPESAPSDTHSPQSIPLPMSFSMGDDDGPLEVERKASFTCGDSSNSEEKASVTVGSAATGAKSVTIADKHQVHEIQNNDKPDAKTSSDGGILVLLEKAAENAGREGMDITGFARALEDEWVTDVEALRRLDGETLDDLLPLMLSRELQRLINHADSIDNKFLNDDRQTLARGRSPKKSTKKKKKKRSHRRAKKRSSHYRPVTPPAGPLTPISEEMDSPASINSDDNLSIVTEMRSVHSSARSVPPKLNTPSLADKDDKEETSSTSSDDQDEADEEYEPADEDDLAQSASIEDLEIRKLHADLIADAREKFPTREALEDNIRERQIEVETAVNSGFDVNKQTLARAALADDEVRKLLPLRLILPTSADLNEMISVLQMHKEGAMRDLDRDMAQSIQSEIDELQDQINLEEQYLLTKTAETQCAGCGEMFPTEKKMKGVLRTKEMQCETCRDDGTNKMSVQVEDVNSMDDEDN